MPLIEVVVPAAEVELAADRAWLSGAAGIWEDDARDGRVSLRVGVETAVAAAVSEALAPWDPRDVTERDAVTLASRAVTVVVGGHQLDVVVPPGVFGDGRHPTTRACLAAIESVVRDDGAAVRVLDVGCGSGILSVAAARLGASVVAIDIDPDAVEATRSNSRAAGVAVAASADDLRLVAGTYDLVVANIAAGTLLELLADLVGRVAPGGRLLLSGILQERWAEVDAALGLPTIEYRVTEDGWTTALVVRPAGS